MKDKKDKPSQYDKVKQITDQLEEGISRLFDSDAYKQYLKTLSRFHDYSLNNTILIAMQKPDATLVAGYTAWQRQFGRQVNKGEKAIRILAPTPYKKKMEVDQVDPRTGEVRINPDGSTMKETKEIMVPAFKVVSVFDVSQTNGRELPSLGVNELTGDVAQFSDFMEALKRTCPVPMAYEEIPSGAKGYFHPVENRIAIQEGMSQVQTIKTAIHEMAHQKLHSIDPKEQASKELKLSRNSKEVEAESVAYTVCQHYGIDTSDYSFAYIAGWSEGRDTPELKASLNRIRMAANEMITEIDGHMAELEKSHDWEHLKAESVTEIRSTGSSYLSGSRTTEHEFTAEIMGDPVKLTMTVSQCDDGEGFVIHSSGRDIWDMMPESELRKLEHTLSVAAEYGSWERRIQSAGSIDAVKDIRWWLMETKNPGFSQEQYRQLYEAMDRRTAELQCSAQRPSVLADLHAKSGEKKCPHNFHRGKAKEEAR